MIMSNMDEKDVAKVVKADGTVMLFWLDSRESNVVQVWSLVEKDGIRNECLEAELYLDTRTMRFIDGGNFERR